MKAISLLKESVEKLPQNPIVRYHLGTAYAKSGEKALVREELTESLRLGHSFPGSEEAETTLKEL